MNERDDIDLLAAEYVLGTLDHEEREDVAARRGREPALEAAIEAWEARLGPLLQTVDEAEPGDLLPAIEHRIRSREAGDAAVQASAAEIGRLRRGLRRWRAAAVTGIAAAAGLAGVLLWSGAPQAPADQRFVAVFAENDEPPSFLLSIDLASRELTIRPIAAPARPDRSYQLWIVGGGLGPTPRSLGLLDTPSDATRKRIPEYDAEVLKKATFGISVEPPGGSPTGRPTGPAIHGTLIPVER